MKVLNSADAHSVTELLESDQYAHVHVEKMVDKAGKIIEEIITDYMPSGAKSSSTESPTSSLPALLRAIPFSAVTRIIGLLIILWLVWALIKPYLRPLKRWLLKPKQH